MTRTETAVRTMLAAGDPLDDTYGYDAAHWARAEAAMARILATGAPARSHGSAHRAPRPRAAGTGRIVLVGGTAVVVGAVGLVAIADQSGQAPRPSAVPAASAPATGSTAPAAPRSAVIRAVPAALVISEVPDESAAQALRRIAKSTRSAEDTWEPVSAAKPYTYLHTKGWYGGQDGEVTLVRPTDRQTWIRDDGQGRLLVGPGEPMFASDAEREKWLADGSPQGEPEDSRFPAGEEGLAPGRSGALPTTVGGLQQVLAPDDGRAFDARERFMAVEDVYNTQVPRPATRAALLALLARTDGVTLVGRTVDRAGRPGLAFSAQNLERNGSLLTLVFDEETGVLLDAESSVLELDPNAPQPGVNVGDVMSYTLYLGFGRSATDTAVPESASASVPAPSPTASVPTA